MTSAAADVISVPGGWLELAKTVPRSHFMSPMLKSPESMKFVLGLFLYFHWFGMKLSQGFPPGRYNDQFLVFGTCWPGVMPKLFRHLCFLMQLLQHYNKIWKLAWHLRQTCSCLCGQHRCNHGAKIQDGQCDLFGSQQGPAHRGLYKQPNWQARHVSPTRYYS